MQTWIEVFAAAADQPTAPPDAGAVARQYRLSREAARHVVALVVGVVAHFDAEPDQRRTPAATGPATYAGVSPAALRLLAAVLAIDPDTAAALRHQTVIRRRPRRQSGPTAAYD